MNNNRDKFEAWAKAHEIDITINPAPSYDARLYNDDETDAMYCGWQAATEQSQKEIAELEANNDKVILALASIRNIFEYDDEMVRSGALRFPEAVAGFVKTKVAELQAREKALVEALQNLVEDISKTHGNYTYEQAWINADEAIANVRGEL